MSALQEQFTQDVALLIQEAKQRGYGATFGEAWRTPQQAEWDEAHGTGIAHSLHTDRLAVDLNLFMDGVYQKDDSAGCYTALGAFWKGLGADHYWGGDFTRRDLDHFSISPDGGATR